MNQFIQTINARNLKGSTFQQPLTRLTVISGANAKGKSSRVEAAILGLAGYIPSLPKTGSGIFAALASGNPMAVELEMSQGNPIRREWRETRGAVKYVGTGDDLEFPVMGIDANEFLALSGPQRTAHLFARAKLPDSFKIPALVATICANVKNIKLEENTEDTEVALNDSVNAVNQLSVNAEATGATPQEFIAALAGEIKEQLRLANENSRRMEKTVQGLTQIKEQSNGSSDIDTRFFAARTELDTANAEVARLRQVGLQLKQDVEAAEKLAATAVDETAVRQQMADMEAKRPVSVQPAGDKPVAKQMATTRPTDTAQTKALSEIAEKQYSCTLELNQSTFEMRQLEDAVESAKAQTNCPTCGHDISDKQKKVVADLRKSLKAVTAKHVSLSTVHAIVSGNRHDAQDRLAEALKAIAVWESAKSAADEEFQFLLDAYNSRVSAFNNYQAALNLFNSNLAALKAKLDGNASAREAAERLPDLNRNIDATRARYKAAKLNVTANLAIVSNLEQEHLKLIQQRSEAASSAKSKTLAEKFKAEAMVYSAVLNDEKYGLMRFYEGVIEKTNQPLLDSVNSLCEGILRLPVAMVEGDFGMRDTTGFVTWKTMSDSERMLFIAALSIALAAEAPFRLCIIGRFESFDSSQKRKVLHRILELLMQGKLDQALIVEVDENPDYSEFKPNPLFSLTVLS